MYEQFGVGVELTRFYAEKIESSRRQMEYCLNRYFETFNREWLEDAKDWKEDEEEWEEMAREDLVFIV